MFGRRGPVSGGVIRPLPGGCMSRFPARGAAQALSGVFGPITGEGLIPHPAPPRGRPLAARCPPCPGGSALPRVTLRAGPGPPLSPGCRSPPRRSAGPAHKAPVRWGGEGGEGGGARREGRGKYLEVPVLVEAGEPVRHFAPARPGPAPLRSGRRRLRPQRRPPAPPPPLRACAARRSRARRSSSRDRQRQRAGGPSRRRHRAERRGGAAAPAGAGGAAAAAGPAWRQRHGGAGHSEGAEAARTAGRALRAPPPQVTSRRASPRVWLPSAARMRAPPANQGASGDTRPPDRQ